MRNILMAVAMLAITAAAQTSKPTKAFELWKPTEVGKDLDRCFAACEAALTHIQEFTDLNVQTKHEFDKDRKLVLARQTLGHLNAYQAFMSSAETRRWVKKYGYQATDGVWFLYIGTTKVKTNLFLDPTPTGCTLVACDRETIAMKVTEFRGTDVFGDPADIGSSGKRAGVKETDLDLIETPMVGEPELHKSMRTARISSANVTVVYKPRPTPAGKES